MPFLQKVQFWQFWHDSITFMFQIRLTQRTSLEIYCLEQKRSTPDPTASRGDHSIGEMVQQMEDRPKRGENAGHNLQKKTKDEDRRLKDMDIEWRNETTYLGVKIDKKLTWGSHIEYARQKARATTAKLYPMTSRTSKLALQNTVTLIKSVLRLYNFLFHQLYFLVCHLTYS